jgi:hypothetical protein
LICLLVLTSSVFGQSGYGNSYGTAPVQQVPNLLSIMRDQSIQQQPLVPAIPIPTQAYGQQVLINSQRTLPIIQQQDTSVMQQKLPSAYGSTLVAPTVLSKALPTQNYGQGYGTMPQLDQQQQQIPVPMPTQTYGQQLPVINQRILPIVQQPDAILMQQKHHGAYAPTSVAPKVLPTLNYGQVNQGYGTMLPMPQFDQQPQVLIPTQADVMCQGQQPETVVPLENGRKFVVCLDNGKGVEQECPKGLVYHPTSQRCERKLGLLDNPCALQPCLNGGQCISAVSSYQCQCAPGFAGTTCELDARICQMQQPCGQSPDTKCQSFRLGAALQYICILQDGLAYGLSPQQAVPSPCQGIDGPQALAVTKNGFILCDGQRMFVESCPGGTIWDDVEKACTWPDMQTSQQLDQQQSYGQSSYGQQQKMIPKSTYGSQFMLPMQTNTRQNPIFTY